MAESRSQLRVGLVGYGRIGKQVARRIAAGDLPDVKLVGIVTRTRRQGESAPAPFMTLKECASESEVLVEAASAEAVPEILAQAMRRCIAVVAISGCAFLRNQELQREARKAGLRLLLPSGAVAGLDGVLSAREEATTQICLTIRRPCEGIEDAKFIRESRIALDRISGETLIFDGTPVEACEGFAGRTNITASVALAGLGCERTRVRIYADPRRTRHEHHLQIQGRFGVAESRVEFDATQPEEIDSIMTLSILATLRQIGSHVRYVT